MEDLLETFLEVHPLVPGVNMNLLLLEDDDAIGMGLKYSLSLFCSFRS